MLGRQNHGKLLSAAASLSTTVNVTPPKAWTRTRYRLILFICISHRSMMAQPILRLAFQAARPLTRTRDPATFFSSCRGLATISHTRTSILPPSSTQASLLSSQHREISSTASRRATVVRKNPRADEDGKDMTIEISDRAAKVGFPDYLQEPS